MGILFLGAGRLETGVPAGNDIRVGTVYRESKRLPNGSLAGGAAPDQRLRLWARSRAAITF